MIERLNFYDIYGYLLPGLTFLGLMWLPFGLVAQRWPPAEWSSALAALVFGYIVGHVLHGLAEQAFPLEVKDRNGELRLPSDILLDDQDESFSPEVKSRLVDRIQIRFNIDVGGARNPDPEVRKKRRQDAFLLCRRALLQEGGRSYAEQFQGMYALMEGVMAAGILAAAYHLGWALARFSPPLLQDVLLYMGVAGLVVVVIAYKTTKVFWWIGTLLFVLGDLLGTSKGISLQTSFLLLGICLTSLFVSLRCYIAYRTFAWHFAATVYRDFCAL